MNTITVVVPHIPMASTAMTYSEVSLSCPPWEIPNPPKKVNIPAAKTTSLDNLEDRIMTCLKAGLTRQRDIFGGRHSGPMEARARVYLNKLISEGRVMRTRDKQGYIWRLVS